MSEESSTCSSRDHQEPSQNWGPQSHPYLVLVPGTLVGYSTPVLEILGRVGVHVHRSITTGYMRVARWVALEDY